LADPESGNIWSIRPAAPATEIIAHHHVKERPSRKMSDRLKLAQDVYRAFSSGDRNFVENLLTKDFMFCSPLDVGLDRDGFFKRCWPGAGQNQPCEFVRLVESGDEVVVTYENTKPNGGRGRNTEVLTFRGDNVCKTEVYFGWIFRSNNLPCRRTDRDANVELTSE
jgi:hypothetical protein